MTSKRINIIGVIGAGTMGQGIAQVAAAAGYKTLLYDISMVALENGLLAIEKEVQRLVVKGKLTLENADSLLNNLITISDLENLKADFIIEAAVEDLKIKKTLLSRVESINGGNATLATNTSSFSITGISKALTNPANFLGVHFFNPAPVMKLVELVAGEQTNHESIDVATDFLTRAGKTVVNSADTPGFIVNRVARHFYLESLRLLENEVATPVVLDQLMRSAGFKMGPFELMDLIGIDVNYAVSDSVYQAFSKQTRFEPSILQAEKVKEGKLGRKTGEGFYRYDGQGKRLD